MVDVGVFNCLNPIDISALHKTSTLCQKHQFVQELHEGSVEVGQTMHDFLALVFDDISCKMGGKRPGHLQFVLLFWVLLLAKELVKLEACVQEDFAF